MTHWENITRSLHKHGGGPLPRAAFDECCEADCAAIAGIARAQKLGLVKATGKNSAAVWMLTQRGLDWCEGRVVVVADKFQRVTETADEKQTRVARLVKDSDEASAACAHLSRREREVLVLASKGFTKREIANILGLCLKSVDNCTTRMLAAIGCSRSIEAAVIAAKAGLV